MKVVTFLLLVGYMLTQYCFQPVGSLHLSLREGGTFYQVYIDLASLLDSARYALETEGYVPFDRVYIDLVSLLDFLRYALQGWGLCILQSNACRPNLSSSLFMLCTEALSMYSPIVLGQKRPMLYVVQPPTENRHQDHGFCMYLGQPLIIMIIVVHKYNL